MPKRTYSIAPKKEVAEFMKDGNSAWTAAEHFGYKWSKKPILSTSAAKKRISGAGLKSPLEEFEEALADEIIELQLMKLNVTRSFIAG
jgi:hypothetical protein